MSLEDHLLGNANERDLRISVFTGPVYSESDPIYRGSNIPQEFWKAVAMISPAGNLHATAYRSSQQSMLDDVEFRVRRISHFPRRRQSC
ncbi:MAG: DNA/RNA non-specific endonuclease [Planctomycetales bacterium]